jgi:hypothetical protein
MAEIKVKDLVTHNISGADLFDDSESFMVELSAEDEVNILGGMMCDGGDTDTGYHIATRPGLWYANPR